MKTDRRGKVRYTKMRLWKGADDQCATCQQPLSRTELGNGVRRCKVCRSKDPGRPDPRTVIVKPRTDQPVTHSWWLSVPRDQWSSAIQAHTFSQSRKTLALNHTTWGEGGTI